MKNSRYHASIIIFTDDFFFVPRFEDGAKKIDATLEIIEDRAAIGATEPDIDRAIPLTEPLEGADAIFLRFIVKNQPALLIFDLQAKKIPWQRWIRILKTSAATRRIPVVAYGPHVDEDALLMAGQSGADEVFSRGKFNASFTKIFVRYLTKEVDHHGCDQELSSHALEGVRLHNAGSYFEAHEALEEAWLGAKNLEASLYRSLLQITVTHLHLQRGNYRGAVKMLLRLRQWIARLPALCRGVDMAALVDHTIQLENDLLEIHEEELSSFWEDGFEPIMFVVT